MSNTPIWETIKEEYIAEFHDANPPELSKWVEKYNVELEPLRHRANVGHWEALRNRKRGAYLVRLEQASKTVIQDTAGEVANALAMLLRDRISVSQNLNKLVDKLLQGFDNMSVGQQIEVVKLLLNERHRVHDTVLDMAKLEPPKTPEEKVGLSTVPAGGGFHISELARDGLIMDVIQETDDHTDDTRSAILSEL